MSWRDGLLPVASGLLVAVIVAFVRMGWSRRQVPTALARSVRRENYLSAVLAESKRADVTGLDVLAPRLTPAARSKHWIGAIQAAWRRIDTHDGVRVVTLGSEDCVKAGAELLVGGIEVRVARREFGAESLSYHLFRAPQGAVPTTLVNHHQDGKDRPARLNGVVPMQPFQDHFSRIWDAATPLESVLAQRIIEKDPSPDRAAVISALNAVSISLDLDHRCVERVLPHLAFRHGSPVILVVGLPGSGKSLVRRRLAILLTSMSIRTGELTDYVYAYRDLIHNLIKLEPPRGQGFEAHRGGAFSVQRETDMMPALQALARTVLDRVNDNEVTLVEFARADLASALQEFDDIRLRSHVIYVSAPEQVRAKRIAQRAEPPETVIEGNSIQVALSDNHLLPSSVERNIYGIDDIEQLTASTRWRDRIWPIKNDADDNGDHIDVRLREFVDELVSDYRPRPPRIETTNGVRPPANRASGRKTVSTTY